MFRADLKLLVLGAGASKAAGYPLSSELIDEIRREARESGSTDFVESWMRWELVVAQSDGTLASLLRNSNPEVVLSVPDLCEAAWNGTAARPHTSAKPSPRKAPGGGAAGELRKKRHPGSPESNPLEEAIAAREQFRQCVDWFFRRRHCEDSKPETRSHRRYLRDVLRALRRGDMVLTLNWDTAVERTLLEDGRWNPMDGYGFEKPLRRSRHPDPPEALNFRVPGSDIVVLKLHGSVGWHQGRTGPLYFDFSEGFLRHLPYIHDGAEMLLVDPDAPEVDTAHDSLVAYPSFLKRLGGSEMQRVWYLAARALAAADSVEIFGYSLPESDVAVRTLLTPLRFRLAGGDVKVRVHDPASETRHRWREFLGDQAEIDQRALC